jgi:hypothetical protein
MAMMYAWVMRRDDAGREMKKLNQAGGLFFVRQQQLLCCWHGSKSRFLRIPALAKEIDGSAAVICDVALLEGGETERGGVVDGYTAAGWLPFTFSGRRGQD